MALNGNTQKQKKTIHNSDDVENVGFKGQVKMMKMNAEL
jgi:hypothetical protein